MGTRIGLVEIERSMNPARLRDKPNRRTRLQRRREAPNLEANKNWNATLTTGSLQIRHVVQLIQMDASLSRFS